MNRFLVILIGSFTAAASHAATVAWGAAQDTGLIDSSGAALGTGNFVRIGYFATLTDSQVQTNALTSSGISTLNGDFREFANTTIGTGTGSAASFSISSSPLYSSLPGFSPSSQIYFWALKSTNNSSLANAVSTATQTAIAYVPFSSNSQWQFPATDGSPGKTIDVANLSDVNRQVLAGTYVAGSSASLTPIFGPSNHALQLAAVSSVPEPSTVVFCGLAMMAAVGSRRRKVRS